MVVLLVNSYSLAGIDALCPNKSPVSPVTESVYIALDLQSPTGGVAPKTKTVPATVRTIVWENPRLASRTDL